MPWYDLIVYHSNSFTHWLYTIVLCELCLEPNETSVRPTGVYNAPKSILGWSLVYIPECPGCTWGDFNGMSHFHASLSHPPYPSSLHQHLWRHQMLWAYVSVPIWQTPWLWWDMPEVHMHKFCIQLLHSPWQALIHPMIQGFALWNSTGSKSTPPQVQTTSSCQR